MNSLLKALAEACKVNRFAEKRLVTGSYLEGHQLLEAAARGGEAWLNVTPVTPDGLAEGIAGQVLAEECIRIIDEGEVLFLIGKTLAEMRSTGALKYFAELEGLYGPEGILKNTLMELRLAGVEAIDIKPDAFVDRQKGEEIKALLAGYERKLRDDKLADQASVYLKAIELLDGALSGEALYLIPEQIEFEYLPFRFLEKLTTGKALVLPAEVVCGLPRPSAFYFKAESEPEPESPLSWLYELKNEVPENSSEDLDFFQAYSPTCEIREVFRRLKKDKINLDGAMICYTNGDAYLPRIYMAARIYGIPVTYAEGLPVPFTRPGKLLSGLLDWIEDRYSSVHVYRLLNTGGFKTKWSYLLAYLLRRAAVGWGRERYAACFSLLKTGLEEEQERAKDKGFDTHYSSAKLENLPLLQKLVSNLLNWVPEESTDGNVQFEKLCQGLAEIITAYASTVDETDRLARESILEMLDQLAKGWPGAVEYPAAVKRIRTRLNSLRVGTSAAAAGHLHAASISRAECVDRQHNFVVGLAGQYFPGSGLQDAVLLDREREIISNNLSLAAVNPERNLFRLSRLLASRRGRVVLSFSCFEPVEGRPAFPAAILLQAFRLKSGKPEADYSDLFNSLGPPAAYYPLSADRALAVNEWWLSLVLGGSKSGKLISVIDCYPGLTAGLAAEEARCGELFTEYDGRVNVDPALVDPRRNSSKTLSASALEKLAGCPYAYFLKYMLYIEQPEELQFDRWAWLNVMERGTLLHKIYARYLRQVCRGPDSPREDRALLAKIAEQEIGEKKKSTPPPSDLVFQSEKNELLRELEFFLKCETLLWEEGSIPIYMEAPFGRGSEAVQEAGTGLDAPLELTLPSGDKILLRGSIDRIDRLPEKNRYRVWDFKTGGTSIYKHRGYIKQGRQIQSAIYTFAAEAILRNEDPCAEVREAGYLFPTEKGEGEGILRDQGRRQEALEAVELMLDLLAAGSFSATDSKETPCKFCDYKIVCRHPHSTECISLKAVNPDNSMLEHWKELQSYE
jgi:RecB family exonuclease